MGEHFKKFFEIPNSSEYLYKARDFVRESVVSSPLDPSWHNKVVLAIDEAVSNIIQHAYGDEKRDDKIEIEMISDAESLMIKILDHGTQFNPDGISDVEITSHVKARKDSGLGVFMMRQIMDEIEYTFKEGVCNELKMVKYYSKKGNK